MSAWARSTPPASAGSSSPRPVFLIYAVPGQVERQPKYFAAAGEPKQIWRVPGADHTGGLDAQPAEYERRVIAFFRRGLAEGELNALRA